MSLSIIPNSASQQNILTSGKSKGMSVSIGTRLPDNVVENLIFSKENRDNSVIFLLTVDQNEFPHVALLSPYQVVAQNHEKLFLLVYRKSRSQVLLRSRGRCTLILQDLPSVLYIVLNVKRVNSWEENDEALYSASIVDISRDYSEKSPLISDLRFQEENVKGHYQHSFGMLRAHIEKLQS